MAVPGRNSPCPCGSGKRYKECHGSLSLSVPSSIAPDSSATPLDGGLREAVDRLNRGDVRAASTLAAEALAANPEDAEAQRILGRCAYEEGRTDEALRYLLQARKAMSSSLTPASVQYAIWSDLNFMFTQALAGVDGMLAGAKRNEYALWLESLPSGQREAAPRVSIILIAIKPGRWLDAAFDSVFAQTYRNLELIVAQAGDAEEEKRLSALLADCPFPHRLLTVASLSIPGLINAGVRASTGQFVNVLPGDDELVPTRIESFVEQVANRGASWSFGGVEFIAADGTRPDAQGDARVRRWTELLDGITEPDTIGHSLIHQDFVAVTAGNLFFERTLFDHIGGFRELPWTYAWDFCLRALWFAEPLHIPTKLYRHRIVSSLQAFLPSRPEFEAAQVAMFREFYERACNPEAIAPNPYAPCLHHWRMHFLKTPFHTGHVLMFDADRLEQVAAAILDHRASHRAEELSPGINLVGFAFGEFGLGESLRAFAAACAVAGIPFVVRDVDMRIRARQADRSVASYLADALRHRCSLYCLNPDMMKPVRGLLARAAAAGGYGIGYWYWELEQLPREWDDALARVDEIWVATEFVAEAMRRSTSKPVVKIPPPIEVSLSRSYTRAEFSLPGDRFLFLFSFDFNSFVKRKNPEGAIAAFKQAFGTRSDVGLVLKSINGRNRPDKVAEMQALVAGDDRIVIMDSFLSRDQVSGLQSVVDAFVSLHRAEGFGLGLAESMYQGKPVIGTAYSGNLEFMHRGNSCLVDYRLVPVAKGEYLYDDERFRWAEPDIEQAAAYMARLVDDGEFRTRIAQRGQQEIRDRFTQPNAAELMRRRLLQLGLL